MTAEEYDVLDEVYFVTGYAEIHSSTEFSSFQFNQILKDLLVQDYLQQLAYDEDKKEFVKLDKQDFDFLENYHYLATKKGLLAHNGISPA